MSRLDSYSLDLSLVYTRPLSLGWVDLDLVVTPFCIDADFHLPKQNPTNSGTTKAKSTQPKSKTCVTLYNTERFTHHWLLLKVRKCVVHVRDDVVAPVMGKLFRYTQSVL